MDRTVLVICLPYSRQAVFTEFQNISAVYTGDLIVLSLWFAVLVALYEEPEKPTSALEYPFHLWREKAIFLTFLFIHIYNALSILCLLKSSFDSSPDLGQPLWCGGDCPGPFCSEYVLNTDVSFLKHHLGAATPENPEIELLRLELAEMKEKYEATVEENKKLKAKVNLKTKFKLKSNLASNDYLTNPYCRPGM